jgi:hypothetical protein
MEIVKKKLEHLTLEESDEHEELNGKRVRPILRLKPLLPQWILKEIWTEIVFKI